MQAENMRPARREQRSTSALRRVGFLTTSALALLTLLSARNARAADDTTKPAATEAAPSDAASDKKDDAASPASASSDNKPAEAATAPEPAKPASEEVAAPAAAPANEALLPAPPGDVARLPPESYPAEPIRGIYGGSLWLTFHGMQWPYSPFHTEAPRTELGFSGVGWVDNGYQRLTTTNQSRVNGKLLLHQSRFTLRATPTYTNGRWFVQGQAEIVAANTDERNQLTPQTVRTDDLWVRAGQWNKWDIQVGRYEAWELYHVGMGLDENTLERIGADLQQDPHPPQIYGVNYVYYRVDGLGNVATHLYPTRNFRMEFLGQLGTQATTNIVAGRGAAILDLGKFKLKGGGEWKHVGAQFENDKTSEDWRGFGGSTQFIFDPRLEFGFNGAVGLIDKTDFQGQVNRAGSVTVYSVGGFANVRVVGPIIVGAGINYTRSDAIDTNPVTHDHTEASHIQGFAAVQALVLNQLFIKAVFGYAQADFAPPTQGTPTWTDKALSGRLRLMYLF